MSLYLIQITPHHCESRESHHCESRESRHCESRESRHCESRESRHCESRESHHCESREFTATRHQQTLNEIGTPLSRTVCAILYPIGMQSWYRPACHEYGPNNMLYASLLINICIIYGVGRTVRYNF